MMRTISFSVHRTKTAESVCSLLTLRGAGPGPAEPDVEVVPTVELSEQEDIDVPWQVVIYNDPVNLMTYVTLVIQRVFGYPDSKAQQIMLDVHHKGKGIAWSGEREKAEYYVHQLQAHQLLAAMKKSN